MTKEQIKALSELIIDSFKLLDEAQIEMYKLVNQTTFRCFNIDTRNIFDLNLYPEKKNIQAFENVLNYDDFDFLYGIVDLFSKTAENLIKIKHDLDARYQVIDIAFDKLKELDEEE